MIKIKGLNCKLGEKEIFKDFNLEIKEGEKILLNAVSGKGKTTLFNILLGFQKAQGEIYIDGCKLTKHTILDSLHKNIRELSGGERQRLGFAICMGLNREIWLLDEVTASLDIGMKLKVKDYILNTNATVLIISHDNIWDFKEVKW